MPASNQSRAIFSESPDTTPAPPHRINPWRRFIGSMIPNWLQRRPEVSQGAKLAYARLAQYAGKNGNCFPRQRILAGELGVSERTARSYICELTGLKLIASDRPGLGESNSYFFLDHPWIHEYETDAPHPQARQTASHSERKHSSIQKRQETSAPIIKENQEETNQRKRGNPHSPPEGDSVKVPGFTCVQLEEIYQAYPRQVAKPAALRAIRRALGSNTFDYLLERTRLYATTCNSPAEFIPHPATWFNGERFNDDPVTWRRTFNSSGKPQPSIVRPQNFGIGVSKL